jgi:hypothetical protein
MKPNVRPWPYPLIFSVLSVLTLLQYILRHLLSPEAEFLEEIQTKVLRIFLLVIHSHLYNFAMRFIFLQTQAKSLWFKKSMQKPQV